MNISTLIARLEEPSDILRKASVSLEALSAALDAPRSTVRAIEEAEIAAPERRARVLARIAQQTIAKTLGELETLTAETPKREELMGLAVSLIEHLEARVRKKEQMMKPFEAETLAAKAYAQRVAEEWPSLSTRIPILFRTDVRITQMAKSIFSECPRPSGSLIYELRIPPTIATDAIMAATRLPGVWPLRGGDFTFLQRPCAFDVDEKITGPLQELLGKDGLTGDLVYLAAHQAQSVLLVEFSKAVAALREFLRIEDGAAIAEAQYPDGGLILDPASLPKDWRPGHMKRLVVLPTIDGLATAAE